MVHRFIYISSTCLYITPFIYISKGIHYCTIHTVTTINWSWTHKAFLNPHSAIILCRNHRILLLVNHSNICRYTHHKPLCKLQLNHSYATPRQYHGCDWTARRIGDYNQHIFAMLHSLYFPMLYVQMYIHR